MNEELSTKSTPAMIEHSPDKPGLIKWLGALFAIGGFFGLLSPLFMPSLISGSASLSFSLDYFSLSTLVNVVNLATGIGMWRGKAWGWWMGALSFLHGVMQNTRFLLAINGFIAISIPSSWARQPGYFTTVYLLGSIVQLAIFAYFFKLNVRTYFGVENRPIWQQVLLIIVVASVIILIFGSAWHA